MFTIMQSSIAQQVSTLFAVKKIEQGKEILSKWPKSYFPNPIILSSLITGLVDGEFYNEAIELFDWVVKSFASSETQSHFRSSVTISSLIQCCFQTRQWARASSFFSNALASNVVLSKNDYLKMIHIFDVSNLWREDYKQQILLPEYKDFKKYDNIVKIHSFLEDNLYRSLSI